MSENPAQLRARAQAEQANADTSTLANVRERSERAAKAWTKMADQAERTIAMRRVREAETAARVAANGDADLAGHA